MRCDLHRCDLAPRGAAYEAGRHCRVCWLWHNDEQHRLAWGGGPLPSYGVRGRLEVPCRHLGPPTGEVKGCEGCRSDRRQVPLRRCAVHGVCTDREQLVYREGGQDHRPAWCLACQQYERPAPPRHPRFVRNLLYHVCPTAGNGVWRRNVEQMRRRMQIFDGRRVVAIVTGRARRLDYQAEFALDSPEAVKEAFGGDVHEWIELTNDSNLREAITFLPLLERVATTDPTQITFYGHAKGVTRPVNDGVTVHRWADLLYESCLDYLPLVEEHLDHLPITGSFKKVGAGFTGSRSAWHYTGSFWWMRNSAVFSRPDWREVDQQWWGVEAWPGLHFGASEAGCLFHEGRVPSLDLFSMDYLRRTVEPAYADWRREHAQWRPQS